MKTFLNSLISYRNIDDAISYKLLGIQNFIYYISKQLKQKEKERKRKRDSDRELETL